MDFYHLRRQAVYCKMLMDRKGLQNSDGQWQKGAGIQLSLGPVPTVRTSLLVILLQTKSRILLPSLSVTAASTCEIQSYRNVRKLS